MKRLFVKALATGLLGLGTCLTPAWGYSDLSEVSFAGSFVVVAGSASLLSGGAELVVESVGKVGESTVAVLKELGKGEKVTVELSAQGVGTVLLATGQVVNVVSEATGTALVASGKLIAYLPNEVGKGLLHHSRAR